MRINRNKSPIRMGIFITALLVLSTGCQKTPPVVSTPSEASGTASSSPQLQEGEIALETREFAVTSETVSTVGRHHVDEETGACGFFNSASGIEFSFEGTSLELYLSATEYKEGNFSWVSVYIDGAEAAALCVKEEGWQKAADGLEEGVRHTVRILKRSESSFGAVYVHKIRLSEGARLFQAPPPATARKIQVLGDSITCGYGNLWTGGDTSDVTRWEDGTSTYATKVAQRFGASLEVIAMAGIGVGNADNTPYPILPLYKDQDHATGRSADFSLYTPDLVIIALGTNDVGFMGATEEAFNTAVENAADLLAFIREVHPDCTILWTYGAMAAGKYTEVIQTAVDRQKAAGDSKVFFLPTTPATPEEGMGMHSHPSMAQHERMADELCAYIQQILGWDEVK